MTSYPVIDVQLTFHADSRGTSAFNLELSKRRSNEVVNYLARAGINKERILSNFVGESQLLNDCGDLSDCDDLQHEMNRTAEFNLIVRKRISNE
jgi:outer membrane protein OmpA-like peptidoglycan-associated protein